jgi:hypothetical protein
VWKSCDTPDQGYWGYETVLADERATSRYDRRSRRRGLMPSHLGQNISRHVTLELVGGINGGSGPEQLGWVRILADGGIEAGQTGNYVVPAGTSLVITDVDWQWDDHGTANAGAAVTLRLFLVTPAGSMRLLESTIVLSPAGKGGTSTNLTAGGVFGPAPKSASTQGR